MSETLHRTVIITSHDQREECPACHGQCMPQEEFARQYNTTGETSGACSVCDNRGDVNSSTSVEVRVNKIREAMPENMRSLLVGPFRAGANSYMQYFFVTSGGSAGRSINTEHEWYCRWLMEEFDHEAILVVQGDGPPTTEVRIRDRMFELGPKQE